MKAAPLDPACAGSAGFWARIGNNGVAFAHWVVLTALAGFLIGLGGPFWFRVFSGLSQIAQMLRSIGIGGKKAEPEGTTADPQTPPDDPAKPKDVIDAFVVAAKVAHGGAAGAGAR